MKRLTTLAVAAACLTGGLLAGEPSAPAGRSMRLFAVGEAPPFRQIVRDGVRREVAPPGGSVPPQRVVVASTGSGKTLGAAELRLGRVSASLKVPVGGAPVELRGPDGATWTRTVPPEEGDFLVVLWRESREGSWDQVRSMVLRDLPEAGGAMLVNVSDRDLALVFGSEKLVLAPGRMLVREIAPDGATGLQIGLVEGGRLRRIQSMSLERGPGDRTLVVIGRSDGPRQRMPVKVTVVREAAGAAAAN